MLLIHVNAIGCIRTTLNDVQNSFNVSQAKHRQDEHIVSTSMLTSFRQVALVSLAIKYFHSRLQCKFSATSLLSNGPGQTEISIQESISA